MASNFDCSEQENVCETPIHSKRHHVLVLLQHEDRKRVHQWSPKDVMFSFGCI